MTTINIFDKIVNTINPIKGLQRVKARAQLQLLEVGYGKTGASKNSNLFKSWSVLSKTATDDINTNLDTLRQRSRQLYMQGGIATGIIKLFKSNVVGSGLMLKSTIDFERLGMTEEEAVKWSKDVEKRFHLWAKSKKADTFGMNNFYELQSLIFSNTLLSGDVFTFVGYDKNSNLNLHVVESDRISTPNNLPDNFLCNGDIVELKNGNKIISGIEIDTKNKAVAVYVANKKNDFGTEWIRVETQNVVTGLPNVLHSFEAERPEQTRGVPLLAHVLKQLREINLYIEGAIQANIISSFFSAFIYTDNKTEMPLGFVDEPGDVSTTEDRIKNFELGAGTINVLGENERVEFGTPNTKPPGIEEFLVSICKIIGSAIEIPYEEIFKTFNSSFSASRAALMEAWKTFNNKRTWFINDICQPVYELWLFQQITLGNIVAPGFLEDEYKRALWCESMWIGSSAGQIDPVKEVNAAIMRINNGLSTRAKEAQELTGTDYYKNVKSLKVENSLLNEAKGVEINEFLEVSEQE